MITKQKLNDYIKEFPDEISLDELIDKLVFLDKLENRIIESKKNEVISEEEVKIQFAKWLE